jgi:hypothetical protein
MPNRVVTILIALALIAGAAVQALDINVPLHDSIFTRPEGD